MGRIAIPEIDCSQIPELGWWFKEGLQSDGGCFPYCLRVRQVFLWYKNVGRGDVWS